MKDQQAAVDIDVSAGHHPFVRLREYPHPFTACAAGASIVTRAWVSTRGHKQLASHYANVEKEIIDVGNRAFALAKDNSVGEVTVAATIRRSIARGIYEIEVWLMFENKDDVSSFLIISKLLDEPIASTLYY